MTNSYSCEIRSVKSNRDGETRWNQFKPVHSDGVCFNFSEGYEHVSYYSNNAVTAVGAFISHLRAEMIYKNFPASTLFLCLYVETWSSYESGLSAAVSLFGSCRSVEGLLRVCSVFKLSIPQLWQGLVCGVYFHLQVFFWPSFDLLNLLPHSLRYRVHERTFAASFCWPDLTMPQTLLRWRHQMFLVLSKQIFFSIR